MQHKSGCNPSLINARLPECLQYTVPVEKKLWLKLWMCACVFLWHVLKGVTNKQRERLYIHSGWRVLRHVCHSRTERINVCVFAKRLQASPNTHTHTHTDSDDPDSDLPLQSHHSVWVTITPIKQHLTTKLEWFGQSDLNFTVWVHYSWWENPADKVRWL